MTNPHLCQWQYHTDSRFASPSPSPLLAENDPQGLGWTIAMSDTSAIVTGILRIMHPDLYRAGCEAMAQLLTNQPELFDLIQRWGTPFTAVSVISNRITVPHRDTKSLMEYFDILTSVGPFTFTLMEFDGIGIQVKIIPGTIIGLCGWVLRHAVPKCREDRVIYAWYMRGAVHASQDVRPASWMTQEVYGKFMSSFQKWLSRDMYSVDI